MASTWSNSEVEFLIIILQTLLPMNTASHAHSHSRVIHSFFYLVQFKWTTMLPAVEFRDCHLSQLSFVSLSQSSVHCVMIVFFLNQLSWWSSFLRQVSRLSSIECRDCPLPQSSLSTFSIKFWDCLLSQSSVVMNLWTMSWVMSVDNNVSYECGWQRDLWVDNDVSHTSGWQCDKCGQRHELQVWTTWVSVDNMS